MGEGGAEPSSSATPPPTSRSGDVADRSHPAVLGAGDTVVRDGLDPADREILVMRHLEQLKISEIASVLAISEGAVKMRRLRAAEKLQELLAEED